MNTIVSITNKVIRIDFKGSNYAEPCYILIDKRQNEINPKVKATYNRKNAGLMNDSMGFGNEIRKATNQRWINGILSKVEKLNFGSPMEIVNHFLNVNYGGTLADNAIII
jgi:hypothetical protein